jgi:hypothetical protein
MERTSSTSTAYCSPDMRFTSCVITVLAMLLRGTRAASALVLLRPCWRIHAAEGRAASRSSAAGPRGARHPRLCEAPWSRGAPRARQSPVHKHVSRLLADDLVGRHARVDAADPHDLHDPHGAALETRGRAPSGGRAPPPRQPAAPSAGAVCGQAPGRGGTSGLCVVPSLSKKEASSDFFWAIQLRAEGGRGVSALLLSSSVGRTRTRGPHRRPARAQAKGCAGEGEESLRQGSGRLPLARPWPPRGPCDGEMQALVLTLAHKRSAPDPPTAPRSARGNSPLAVPGHCSTGDAVLAAGSRRAEAAALNVCEPVWEDPGKAGTAHGAIAARDVSRTCL